MTKKRFIIYNYNDCIIEDNWTGKDFLIDDLCKQDAKRLCDLLNELHNKYIDEYALRETLQSDLQRVEEKNKELHEENEQLKQRLRLLEYRFTEYRIKKWVI